jgi:NAD(P)-dependent dehydrogenase (short-subunit alcohol dehydrogenase family)
MSDRKTAIVTGATGGIGAGLVDGDIGKQETAAKTVEAAIQQFGTIDVLVNSAGIMRTKPFTDFTTEDFNTLVSVNLLGFFYITQVAVKQMLRHKSGNVVNITAALADQPIAGLNASVSMMTKGGLNTATRSLAIEYAKEGIRFNAVAPGASIRHCTRMVPRILLRQGSRREKSQT